MVAVRGLLPVLAAEKQLLADIPEAFQVGHSPLDGIAGHGQIPRHGVQARPGDTIFFAVAEIEVHVLRPLGQAVILVNLLEIGYAFTPLCGGGLREDMGCGAGRCSGSGITMPGNAFMIAASIIALSA